ncbi:S1 family peptidase [Streptomyces sp. B-S-A8]|uniref:S1 family peptidase n=1 Tax=Streptomyces solicavernae TaxID=3043614 RepID=A0ABT6RP09_9ACTN|nr:S1 family peptidase [Streptomyces sp. B-S-A8]MDI3386161.1 S1 family peptidase [Streptomyces sp. B-S-A8]
MKRTPLALAVTLAALPLSLIPGSASATPESTPGSTPGSTLGSTLGSASGEPSPEPGVRVGGDTYERSSALARLLGERSAGSYLDARSGELITTVTDAADAERVREAGGTAKVVERTGAELRAATAALEKHAKIPGTSWGVDPRRNQVVVEADTTVSAADFARIERVADGLGGAVRVVRVPGEFRKEVAGGDAVHGGGLRCSAAFNVSSGSARYFLTAGHCTDSAAQWSASSGGPVIGERTGSNFPGDDFGIVRYTDGSAPAGHVNLYNGGFQDITSAADAVVGQAVRKSGSTTKVTSGSVTQTNVTVNYGDGNSAYGMVRTNVCSSSGDSGGAHFAGTTALGIHSGSGGTCDNGVGSAVFQPVKEALSTYGVRVY